MYKEVDNLINNVLEQKDKMQKENCTSEGQQYVGPYRLEKTLGKGQTGEDFFSFALIHIIYKFH